MSADLSLKEMLGELFMTGFEGFSPPDYIEKLVKKYHIGGVILFKRNINSEEQVKKLTSDLKKLSKNLFISIDQEGGRVARLPFVKYKSSLELASAGDENVVYNSCARLAKELDVLGINMNFAPVLDVNTNQANPVIGDRAFGADPQLVARMGVAAVKGLEENKIVSCGKHFPGHGDTAVDSHVSLPIVNSTRERLDSVELIPFKAAIAAGVSSIMTAHVLYPAIDDKPATLSKKIITKILRQDLGFSGIIVTDDLDMGAISGGAEASIIESIEAGADIMLICHSFDKIPKLFEFVLNYAKNNSSFKYKIRASYNRIKNVKKNCLGMDV